MGALMTTPPIAPGIRLLAGDLGYTHLVDTWGVHLMLGRWRAQTRCGKTTAGWPGTGELRCRECFPDYFSYGEARRGRYPQES